MVITGMEKFFDNPDNREYGICVQKVTLLNRRTNFNLYLMIINNAPVPTAWEAYLVLVEYGSMADTDRGGWFNYSYTDETFIHIASANSGWGNSVVWEPELENIELVERMIERRYLR